MEIRSFDPIHHGRDESRRRTRAIPHGLVPLRLAEIKLERKSLVGIYRREEEKKSCLLVFPRRESCIPPPAIKLETSSVFSPPPSNPRRSF